MAADFPVRPVTEGKDACQFIILGLPECLLDQVAVKACFHDLIGRPVRMVGDYNVFPKSFDVLTYTVVILSEDELRLSILLLKSKLIKVFWEVKFFASLQVVLLKVF